MKVDCDVPLSSRTSLQLGGPVDRLVSVESDEEVEEFLRGHVGTEEPLFLLGGGTNLVVADEGFRGTALSLCLRSTAVVHDERHVLVRVGAGHRWDDFVARAVGEGWAGVECLSGIPGSVGATPMQNVGAYGQEVSDVVARVHVFDRDEQRWAWIPGGECRFGYRSSRFRGSSRYVISEVEFRLERSPVAKPIRYAELARSLGEEPRIPLALVRERVLELRRKKGMVLDANDPDSVSAGSFFTNPILAEEQAVALTKRFPDMPRFAAGPGLFKVPAAWLMERSGVKKGEAVGGVGISSKHALALINRGGTATELVRFARGIHDRVAGCFGVKLEPEPIFLGLSW